MRERRSWAARTPISIIRADFGREPLDDSKRYGADLQRGFKNEEFVKIIGTLEYTIPPTNLNHPEARTVSSHHAMIVPRRLSIVRGYRG